MLMLDCTTTCMWRRLQEVLTPRGILSCWGAIIYTKVVFIATLKKYLKVLNIQRQYKLQIGYLVDNPWRQFTTRYDDRDYKCVLCKSCRSRKVRRKVNTKAEDIVKWIERWPVAFSFDEDYIRKKFRIKVR